MQAAENDRHTSRKNYQKKNHFEDESLGEDSDQIPKNKQSIIFKNKRRLQSFDMDINKKSKMAPILRTNSEDFENQRSVVDTPKLNKKN